MFSYSFVLIIFQEKLKSTKSSQKTISLKDIMAVKLKKASDRKVNKVSYDFE